MKRYIETATACALWRYDNLLCGKAIQMHDEYWQSHDGGEMPSPLLVTICREIQHGYRNRYSYFKRGLKRAAGQFINIQN
jgi:hypothetical protein